MKFVLSLLLAITPGLVRGETLPGTKPIVWEEEDLSQRLMDEAHRFVEGEIVKTMAASAGLWSVDASDSATPYRAEASRFAKMIGVVDSRISPAKMERFGDDANPALISESPRFTIHQVRWPVLEGVSGEGLLVAPKEKSKGIIVVVPDASQTPEELIGLRVGDPEHRAFVRRLAHHGFTLVIPALINREIYEGKPGENQRLKRSRQSHREWIYRQAFHMGRHIIGYEVQRILAVVDWAKAIHPDQSIAVSGYGEGGMLAFFAAAIDDRIEAAHVRGYIAPRDKVWNEPIDRNIFGRLSLFDDPQIMWLISTRPLLIDSIAPPVFEGKGVIPQPDFEEVHRVLERARQRSMPLAWLTKKSIEFPLAHRFFEEPSQAVQNPIGLLQNGISPDVDTALLEDQRKTFSAEERHQRLFSELERHVQSLVRASDLHRDEWFLYRAEPKLRPNRWSTKKRHPTLDPAEFIEKCESFRDIFRRDAIGEFAAPLAPLNPRSRKILETEKWTAWDVVLDVAGDFFAWGTLVLPRDIAPGEKRPVVVCQHGRNGVPRDTIDQDKTAYNDYAAKLAERGFITFAPHNLYRGEDQYRWLDRKANTIGCSLFSFIAPSHQQILNWLKSRPQVDPGRIAFYGLSYGGETAVRVPPLVTGYSVVICSGDFNQWTRKVAATDFPGSFTKTIEWEMPYWNWGHTFDYSEMAALIFPRPFMVERGHHDRVSTDQWVAHEYAKVRWLYAQFGMADRTEIEFFQGGHSINGEGAFRFLHKHLDWKDSR